MGATLRAGARARAAASSALLAIASTASCEQILDARFDDATLGADAGPEAGADAKAMQDDAPDAGDDDAGAILAIAPPDAGPLGLWLAADRGIEGDAGIGAWRDLSGAAHDATQSIAAIQPRRAADDAGLPRVAFTRARATCLDVAWPDATIGGAATIFVVAGGPASSLVRFDGDGGRLAFPMLLADPPGAQPESRLAIDLGPSTVRLRTGHAADPLELLTAQIDPDVLGGTATFRDGDPVERGSLVLGSGTPRFAAVTLGCAANGTDYADADVAEILVYTAALDDPTRRGVEAYLKSRWHL